MARGGSSSVSTGVDIKELREFRRSLKDRADAKAWVRTLASASKRGGQIIVNEARSNASGMGGQQAAAAGAIKASASAEGISIRVGRTARAPFGLAAFWGAERQTGWYGQGRYFNSMGVQFKPWVGASWDVGQAGEGPYAVNAAIASKIDEVMDGWSDDVIQIMNEI